MLGVTTPAIGPTVEWWWQGSRRHRAAGLEQRDRVLRVVDQPLEGGAAHQRAAQRAGRAVPGDRRAGVQELPALQAEQLGRGRHVDQRRGHAQHGRERPGVGLGPARVGGHGGEVGLGAGHRRSPVDAGDRHRLVGDRVGQQVGAGVDHGGRGVHRSPSTSSTARRVAPALDRWTSAPASASARTWRSRPCGSAAVPTTATTTGCRTAAIAGCEQRGRVGLGAVPEDDVEQDDRGLRVGGGAGQVLEPQRRVDHRVRPAGGVGVVAEVHEACGRRRRRAPRSRSAWPRRPGCRRRTGRAGAGRWTALRPSRSPARSARRGRAGAARPPPRR